MQKCLHPALFAFNKLNIRALRSVCTLALCLHFTCTYLHNTYTTPTLYLHLHHCHVSQHREVERAFGATEYSTSPYTNTAMAQPQTLLCLGVQASCAGRCVHKSDYCLHTRKHWLPTRYDKKCKVQAKSPNKYLGLCTCTLCTYNPLTAQAPNATSKRYLTTQAQNASTSGGDASRIGKRCSYLFRRACFHLSLFPTRDASPPLVLAF